MRKLLFAVLTTALAITACGTDRPNAAVPADDLVTAASSPSPDHPEDSHSPSPSVVPQSWLQRPPAIVVSGGGRRLDLHPHTYCLSAVGQGTCADGIPPDPLPDLGVADTVLVSFPMKNFRVHVNGELAGAGDCSEFLPAVASRVPGGWSVRPRGTAGRYEMHLQVVVPGGALDTAFVVTTPNDGSWPEPEGGLYGLTGGYQPGDPIGWSEPLRVDVSHLGGALLAGRGRLQMSGSAHSLTMDLAGKAIGCEGSIRFAGDLPARTLEETLGDPPYDIDVTVQIDGQAHTARAVWPRDQTSSDVTPLLFEPPLPSR